MSLILRCIASASLGLTLFSQASASLNWELVEWHGLPLLPSALAADESLYVAADKGIVMSSTNGTDWIIELQTSGITITCLAIWNGSIYAGTREGRILSRPAGQGDWTMTPVIFAPPDGHTFPISIQQIIIGDDRAVATSRTSFSVSLDGTTWSEAAPLPEDVVASPEGCAFANGLFMMASYRGTSFAISPNGTEWAKVNLVGFNNMNLSGHLQHHNGIWVAGAERVGGQARVLVSTDGSIWEESSLPFQYISSFATSPDEFAVVGRSSGSERKLARSTDGKFWTSAPIEFEDPQSQLGPRTLHEPVVTKGPAGYFAVEHRSGGVELTTSFISPDGMNWAPVNLPPDEIPPYATITLAGAEGAFFHDGFADSGPLFSKDGKAWIPIVDLMDEQVEVAGVLAIAEVDAGLFLLSDNKVLLRSSDGEVWAQPSYSVEGFPSQPFLTRLASFDGYLYAMATEDIRFEHFLVKSHDGITWTHASDTEFSRGHQLLQTNDGLIVYSTNGSGYLTQDGTTWENIDTNIKNTALKSVESTAYARSLYGEIEQWSLSDGYRSVSPFEASQGRKIHTQVVEMTSDGRFFVVSTQKLNAGTDLGSLEEIHSPLYIQNVMVRGNRVIASSDAGILTATLRPEDYIWDQNSHRYTTWVESEWFGWLFDEIFPYVYHATQGWQYQTVDSEGNIAIYDYGLGKWVWTSQSFYPFYWAYDGEDSGWFYYERESQTPDRWFYDYNTEKWIQEPDFSKVL